MYIEVEIATRDNEFYPALFNKHSIIAIYPSLMNDNRSIIALTNGKEYELNQTYEEVRKLYGGQIKT